MLPISTIGLVRRLVHLQEQFGRLDPNLQQLFSGILPLLRQVL